CQPHQVARGHLHRLAIPAELNSFHKRSPGMNLNRPAIRRHPRLKRKGLTSQGGCPVKSNNGTESSSYDSDAAAVREPPAGRSPDTATPQPRAKNAINHGPNQP